MIISSVVATRCNAEILGGGGGGDDPLYLDCTFKCHRQVILKILNHPSR